MTANRALIRLVLALSGLYALPAHASLYCAGNPTAIYTTSDGHVSMRNTWRNDWTYICNVNEEWKGVPPQTCWAWFAQINSAIVENKQMTLLYMLPDSSACATLPTYASSPAPAYVLMVNASSVSSFSMPQDQSIQ